MTEILKDTLKLRREIIDALAVRFESDIAVRAIWLEGSDGLGKSDEYSDLDFWLDVEDGQENVILDECVKVIEKIGPLDYSSRFVHPHPKIFQHCLHISGSTEYLLVDICVQSHSRGQEGCTFTRGDIAEFPFILFDKDSIIAVVEPQIINPDDIRTGIDKCIDVFSQRSRVVKYIKRGKYLEALAYYNKYVLCPITDILRLLYTPKHSDYGLVHISDHLPQNIVMQLEGLHKISCLEDIERSLPIADEIFKHTDAELRTKYNI